MDYSTTYLFLFFCLLCFKDHEAILQSELASSVSCYAMVRWWRDQRVRSLTAVGYSCLPPADSFCGYPPVYFFFASDTDSRSSHLEADLHVDLEAASVDRRSRFEFGAVRGGRFLYRLSLEDERPPTATPRICSLDPSDGTGANHDTGQI